MHGIELGMVRLNGDQQWHQCKKGTHTSIYTTGRTKKEVQNSMRSTIPQGTNPTVHINEHLRSCAADGTFNHAG